MPLVEQELLTLPGHTSSPPVLIGVRVTRSLVLYVCFVNRCLSFCCTFSFGHCVVCSSSIYGFWLSLWYLQTLLTTVNSNPSWLAKGYDPLYSWRWARADRKPWLAKMTVTTLLYDHHDATTFYIETLTIIRIQLIYLSKMEIWFTFWR